MDAFFEQRNYSQNIQIFTGVLKNLNFAAHWHTDTELIYVIEGSIVIGINTQIKILNRGDLAIFGRNDIHYFKSDGVESKILAVFFNQDMLDSLSDSNSTMNLYSKIFTDINGDFHSAFKKIADDVIINNSADMPAVQPLLRLRVIEMILVIFRHEQSYYMNTINRSDVFSSAKPVQTAMRYIEKNYAQDISLEIISSIAGLSPYYFSRLFKITTGTSFKKFLSQFRISKATELICSTHKTIIDIAYETGFNSVRTFNRTFINIAGYSPTALRKNK